MKVKNLSDFVVGLILTMIHVLESNSNPTTPCPSNIFIKNMQIYRGNIPTNYLLQKIRQQSLLILDQKDLMVAF